MVNAVSTLAKASTHMGHYQCPTCMWDIINVPYAYGTLCHRAHKLARASPAYKGSPPAPKSNLALDTRVYGQSSLVKFTYITEPQRGSTQVYPLRPEQQLGPTPLGSIPTKPTLAALPQGGLYFSQGDPGATAWCPNE